MSILQFPKNISINNIDEIAKIKKITSEIFELSKELKQKPISHIQQQNIFHHQILKSSLFSARIEGNNLTLAEARSIVANNQSNSANKETNTQRNKSKLEISNVLKTLQNIHKLTTKISNQDILSLHNQIMDGIDNKTGAFRKKSSGIFDGLGNIVYLTPEPKDTQEMLKVLLKKINSSHKQNQAEQLILAAQCHYYFEKSHPFIDGNGRTGRVILQYQLLKTNLFANYILPIDEYFEKNRSNYYFYLEKNTRNINHFIIFFLEGIIFSLKELLKKIDETSVNKKDDHLNTKKNSLLPRRQELINIVQDHPYISLDSLSRRFPTVAKRTISYDINWLVKNNFITKHGETRGVRYSSKQHV